MKVFKLFCAIQSIIFLLLGLCTPVYGDSNTQSETLIQMDTLRIDELRLKGLELIKIYPDSSIVYIKEAIRMSEVLQDKIRIAKGLNCLGITYAAIADFKESIYLYKNALKIIEDENSPDTKSGIYNNLGVMYESFGQYDLAEEYYIASIDIIEKTNSPIKEKFLNHTLGNLALIYRYKGDYIKSLKYNQKALDVLKNADIDLKELKFRNASTLMEKGMTYLKMGKYSIAKELLFANYEIVEDYGETSSTAEAYYYVGSLHKVRGEYAMANLYLLKALELTNSIRNLQLKIDILLDLSSVYNSLKEDNKAFEYLKKGTVLKDSLFGTQNTWSIYEIKEDYEKEQQRQKLALTQKEKEINSLMKKIYLSGTILISLLGLLYFRFLRIKYGKAKKLMEKEKQIAELELSKTKDILEIKNKELTTSALQIIENGELIKQFKNDIHEIKKDVDPSYHQKLERLSTSIHNNSKKNWDVFKVRFEQVNTDFFKRLKEQYPSLSPTELKLCSFLKLNFSSKDIANLMGISDKSVKMNRYRLRKKFNISRDVNLIEFISKF